MQTFKTPKGTVLPLLDLVGKPYLQVAHRIVWFREENPDWLIEVTFPILDKDHVLAKAVITDTSGKVRSMAHRVEFKMDDLEKAETGAIGRALGFLGYGTQFAGEILEEGPKLADAPIQTTHKELTNHAPVQQSQTPYTDATAGASKAKSNLKGPSPAQVKRLWGMSKTLGWSYEDVYTSLKQHYQVSKPEELDWKQYKAYTDELQMHIDKGAKKDFGNPPEVNSDEIPF